MLPHLFFMFNIIIPVCKPQLAKRTKNKRNYERFQRFHVKRRKKGRKHNEKIVFFLFQVS